MYILFDVGATKTRIALARDDDSFEEPFISDTPREYNELMSLFDERVKILAKDEAISAIVGGVAGPLDREKTTVVMAPNLPALNGHPFARELAKRFDTKVFLENDAALVGLGEMAKGSGRDSAIGAYLTVSTGVGGARFIGSRIDQSRFGFEPGHQIIDFYNSQYTCEKCMTPGHLESFISGASFEKRFKKKAYKVTDEVAWNEAARILAVGLFNLTLIWSPDVFVLGGSMMVGTRGPVISLEKTQKYFQDFYKLFPESPRIVLAQLGAIGGIYGALEYARQKIDDKKK
jgi:predicted NBD/HSP70 family sugar kinase